MLALFSLYIILIVVNHTGWLCLINHGFLTFKTFLLNRRERNSGCSEHLSSLLIFDGFYPVIVKRFNRYFTRAKLIHHPARVLWCPVSLPVAWFGSSTQWAYSCLMCWWHVCDIGYGGTLINIINIIKGTLTLNHAIITKPKTPENGLCTQKSMSPTSTVPTLVHHIKR